MLFVVPTVANGSDEARRLVLEEENLHAGELILVVITWNDQEGLMIRKLERNVVR